MASDYEDDQEASQRVGGSGTTRTDLNLGSAGEWVTGTSVDWRGLVSYVLTIGVLIVAETGTRLVAGVLALPRMGVDKVGDVYADLTGETVGLWPAVFETAFDVASRSFVDLGPFGFIAAVVFVVAWFLVINDLYEVL